MISIRPLTFATLRTANLLRIPLFKNSKGELSHSKPDGSYWSPNDWLTAVTGELGELANLLKKCLRGDTSIPESRAEIARELADVQTYLDILAYQLGVDLGGATANKWNEVSERIGVDLRIHGDSVIHPDGTLAGL